MLFVDSLININNSCRLKNIQIISDLIRHEYQSRLFHFHSIYNYLIYSNVYEIDQINMLRYFLKYYSPYIIHIYILTFSHNVASTLKVFPLLTILTL